MAVQKQILKVRRRYPRPTHHHYLHPDLILNLDEQENVTKTIKYVRDYDQDDNDYDSSQRQNLSRSELRLKLHGKKGVTEINGLKSNDSNGNNL